VSDHEFYRQLFKLVAPAPIAATRRVPDHANLDEPLPDPGRSFSLASGYVAEISETARIIQVH